MGANFPGFLYYKSFAPEKISVSNTVMVTNLPLGTTREQLLNALGVHGEIEMGNVFSFF